MDQPLPATRDGFAVLPLGDAAVTVEFGCTIEPGLNERALAFAQAVRFQQWEGVVDIVPAYAAVTIHVDPFRLPLSILSARLHDLSFDGKAPLSGRAHRIPVLYGGECGPDLQDIAAFARQSLGETIRRERATDNECDGLSALSVVPAVAPPLQQVNTLF